jgi:arylsulfatase A-like enzyme
VQRAPLTGHGEDFPPVWVETIKALYELETVDVDRNVGRFLHLLRELDLYDDAVILLTADHGEELWDHGRYEHGHTLYDELLRVPLIIKAPSISPGRVAARVATTQAPRTVVEAAGLKAEDAHWAPSLPDGDAVPDGTLLIGATLYFDRQVGIIFDDRKYIRNLDDGSELLFDLAADPDERRPLTDRSSLDAARQRLDERLQRSMELRKLFADETPAPNTIPPDLLRSLGYL